MRIIAVALSKGGVGKTTTAINLAHGLAITKRRVLLIDTDTQNQCAKGLGIEPTHGLASFMLDNTPFDLAICAARENLDVLAGGTSLAGLTADIGRADFRPEETLKNALQPHLHPYDYVIIDSGPSWDPLTVNVLFLATELLTPVNLDMASFDGLILFLQRVKQFNQYHDLKVNYIVPTALDRRVGLTGQIREQIEDNFTTAVCDPIPYNIRLAEAYAFGQSIFEYDPRSAGAHGYATLVKRIIEDE